MVSVRTFLTKSEALLRVMWLACKGKDTVDDEENSNTTQTLAEFELECDELEGRFEIKPNPFL